MPLQPREIHRFIIRLSVLLAVAWLASACSPPNDGAIRFGLPSSPVNLDPRYASDAVSARINRLLYQRLVDFDEDMRPVPSLADWEQLSPTHYRFTLSQDRPAFHDGTPLAAADVAATYRSILEPGSASIHAGTLSLVNDIRVIDTDTVDFLIDRADPLFPGYLVIGILPASGIVQSHPFHSLPVGSGGFRLLDWADAGRLRLQRLDDGQVVEFLTVGDPTVRVLKLQRGELDILQNDLPAELVRYLEKQDGIDLHRTAGSNFAYIGFNNDDPHSGNENVRHAISHAIDREAIIEHLLGGAARPAATLLPPEHWAGHDGLQVDAYDPGLAKRLLSEAGYGNEQTLVLQYKTSTDPVRMRIATVIQQQLGEAGIQVEIASHDWGTFFGDIKQGRFQMYSLMWVGIKTPDIFRYAFHSASLPPGGANRGRLVDAVVDALIVEAQSAGTLDEQAVIYRRLQERLAAVWPYVPLWYEDHVAALGPSVEGYRLASDGNYDGLRAVRRITVK